MPKVERIDLAHLLADAWRWHAINDTMAVNAGHGEVDAQGWLTGATGVDRDASALGHRMLKAGGGYDTASGRAADLLEEQMPQLLGLLMREAGKTAANAVAEVREAVDFLRYYAAQAQASDRGTLHVGMAADTVWLSTNPLEVAPTEIPAIQVLGTWLAGARTH